MPRWSTTDTSIKGINPEPVIGVIGGAKSVGIDKFIVGYIAGRAADDPKVEVKVAYSNNFGDPAIGLQMTKAMFEEGADIVYQVAGGTGMGVIQAAKEAGHYAIGVDTDQDSIAPGAVLTSMVKRTDVAVETVIKDYADGKLAGGKIVTLGLKEGGVGLSDMKETKSLIPGRDSGKSRGRQAGHSRRQHQGLERRRAGLSRLSEVSLVSRNAREA